MTITVCLTYYILSEFIERNAHSFQMSLNVSLYLDCAQCFPPFLYSIMILLHASLFVLGDLSEILE